MNAMVTPLRPPEPESVQGFALPKRPKVAEREPEPLKKNVAVIPFRACTDARLHGHGLRVLALLCSYTNRAGITWVGHQTLAKQLGVSRQSVSRQMRILRELGYLQTLHRGYSGVAANTVRVIFDAALTAEDAIAITSPIEDTRPPHIRHAQEAQMSSPATQPLAPDPKGQERVNKALADALKRNTTETQPNRPKEFTMPKEDTYAVRQVKQAMAEAQARRRQPKPAAKQPANNPANDANRPPQVAVVPLPAGSTNSATTVIKSDPESTDPRYLECSPRLPNEVAAEGFRTIKEGGLSGVLLKQSKTETHTSTQPDCPPELAPLDGDSYRSLLEAGLPPDVVAELAPFAIDAWRSEGVNPSAKQVATVIRHMWSGDR